MGRVERRMYRRRRKRAQVRLVVIILLLLAAAVLAAHYAGNGGMTAQRLTAPSPTPVTATWDTSPTTREVTLSADCWYAIQTGVFSTEDAALQKADAYTGRGAPGTVIRDGAKWRVFIACYGSEDEAAAVRTRLGEMQRVETYLYQWQCPELRLRLTGQAGQLDVVEAGLAQLTQIAARLRDAAILLDAGQITASEALAEVTAIDGQLALWAETARSRFTRPYPELLTSLLQSADGWEAVRRELLSSGESSTALSAALKAKGMALYDAAIALRSGISTSD